MAIVFACPGCEKRFKVEEDKAGRKGKCPSCDTTFLIPAARETVAERPAPPRHRPIEDEPPEEERPKKRRKKKKKGSSTGLIVSLAAGAVGLLVALGLGIWLLVRLTGPGGAADDLKYLPDNLHTFFSLNTEQLTTTDLYKRLQQETALLRAFDTQGGGDFTQELANTYRITAAAGAGNDNYVAVIRYKTPVNLNNRATKGRPNLPQQEKIGGHEVRHNGSQAAALVDRKTLIEGPLPVVKQVLERGGSKASMSANLAARFKELDFSKRVAFARDNQSAKQQGQPNADIQLALQSLPAEQVVAHLDLGATATYSATLTCAGTQEAEDLKKQIDSGLALFRGPIPFPGAPPGLMEAAKGIQVTVHENKVSLSGSVDNDTLVELAKKVPNVPRR